jgi:hypothetical protein
LHPIDSTDATVKSYTFLLIHIIAIISFVRAVDVYSFFYAFQDTVLSQPVYLPHQRFRALLPVTSVQ